MSFVEALAFSDVSHDISRLAHELSKESVKSMPKKNQASRVKAQSRAFNSIRMELQKSFTQYYDRIKHGLELLSQAGLLGKMDREKIVLFIAKAHDQHFVGKSVQDEIGLLDELMVAFHEYGSQFLKSKEIERSADVFLVLTFLNPFVPSFWVGLGMAEEMKQDYDAAALSFIMAAEMHGEGYSWAIKAAECLVKAGKKEQARKILDTVIDETGKAPQYMREKESAVRMKALV